MTEAKGGRAVPLSPRKKKKVDYHGYTWNVPQPAGMRIAMASGTARCASNHHVFFNSSYNNRDQLNPYNPPY